ncbi:low molecular weight phosphatase family protein [Corynebacterium sp. TAE3-ERU12]|uniref:arsenate reductase/protein-tyrosine-phosphatase family protein n=1 Tax=Corynebacterium sp. TAE3-ERU12 TaxID=2849491 RepID=UPI001C453696|nr:low molecular weight phosphatase family protein [Corynebacterium sp. TAE3-ERU12]MBV7295951.1 low molecular weight phosphatase family protein [Corynebacterium sp. TAE3-ERU12]
MSAATPRILFVCTGNICRSAAAEVISAQWAREHNAPLEFASAGVYGLSGEPVEATIADILQQRGVPTDGFCASRLTGADVRKADLVLCMEEHHRDAVVRIQPAMFRRVFLLRRAAALAEHGYVNSLADFSTVARGVLSDQDWGIADPYGKDRDVCQRSVDIISAALAEVLPVVVRES